ncbi:MAG: tripartite tricarboxylate transporter substrate binding protein [Betaproteobacteria bacterium]|nr:tripartite tricarboxylate transporter substrate binding protein [Betaproteobacteria bacterium]
MKTRKISFQVLGATIFTIVYGVALAQDAARPIRIVQGFAPGGGHDTVARLLAPRVGAQLKLKSIVEARPGANGIIAAEYVARTAPDGNTVFLTGVSTFVLNQLVYAKVPYDTLKDFAPLTTVAATPQILVAHPGLPVRTLKDVAALARRSPKKLSIGSPGIGGLSHLTLEVFKSLGKLEIEHVPYKGTASALTELLSGFVPLFIGDVPAPLPHVKSGKLRAIIVTGETRSPLLPDVPTAREQGYPGLQAMNWYGVMVPAATPPAVVSRLHAAFVSAVGAPETRERYAGIGVDPLTSKSPAAFASFVQEEFARWGKVVRSTGIQLQQ